MYGKPGWGSSACYGAVKVSSSSLCIFYLAWVAAWLSLTTTSIWPLLNPSPPVLIYSRQSQNVQSFDPSGWLDFICKRKRKSIAVTKKKKNLYYGWERVIYTGKSFSVAEKRDEVEPHRHWGLGLSVTEPVRRQDDEYLSFISRVFLNITKHSKLALFIEKYNSLSKKTMNEHITVR